MKNSSYGGISRAILGLLLVGMIGFFTQKTHSQEAEKSAAVEPPKAVEEKSEAQEEKIVSPKPADQEKQIEEKPKEVLKNKTESASEKKLTGCVAPIKDLVKTYQKELDALQKLMEKWDSRLQTAMQRESLLSKEIKAIEIEYDKKKDSDEKREQKEAARLQGQLKRLLKEQKILKKELLKQCKELSAEIGEFGKGSSQAIAEQIRQIRQEIETLSKEE